MKFLYYIVFFFLFQANFAQEQVTFYFDNNKFELYDYNNVFYFLNIFINWAKIKIDNEIKSLNDDQRNILFNDKNYISIDTQLKILVQEALVNSVKNVIENSEIGNKLLTQQLNLIKTNKDKIIAESNRELETFKKFQIAAQANPNLTYKEFCENINNK